MPFTAAQFFENFAYYNQSVWPFQIVLYLLALACIGLVFRSRPSASRLISLVLAFFWLWMGLVYHLAFFSRINAAAWMFGVAFVIEALILGWLGVVRAGMSFRSTGGITGVLGWGLVAVALAIYPIAGYLAGQRYPAFPTFGMPCPTTIFSIGILLFASRPRPRSMLVVPVCWTIIGSFGAFSLGVTEDLTLLLAGTIGFGMILQKNPVHHAVSSGRADAGRVIHSGVGNMK